MNRLFYMNHSPISKVYFSKNVNDFVVNEIPLYEFSGEGEHLVLHVRKKGLTTWQMLQDLSAFCGAKIQDFGYAGLKDKDGMTTQYISINKKYANNLENFSHEKIKILSINYHNNKIKIGHLKGNKFFIRLKKVSSVDALKLENVCQNINKEGFPNYFGYQRFGINQDNYKEGKEILEGKRREKNKKLSNFLINAYQSELFNRWLNKRVEMSKYFKSFNHSELKKILNMSDENIKILHKQPQFFKIMQGDVLHHYPHGKAFVCQDIDAEVERFIKRDITVTGWLVGENSMRSEGVAMDFDNEVFKEAEHFLNKINGARRFGWTYLEDFEFKYKKEEAHFEMSFMLQKGSYATVVLEEIMGKYLD